MQAYGPAFAHVYNQRWGGFARQAAPHLLAYYAATPAGQARRPVLDLCCGTGHLAAALLEAGYSVTGLDLSPAMLHLAAANTAAYTATGQARFVLRDAADFALPEPVGLVVSTYDALNHLPDLPTLRRCFACVAQALEPGGSFIFDLNTRRGLLDQWNGLHLTDGDELVLLQRGLFPAEGDRAWTKLSGFVRQPDGRYERFDETVFNTAFPIAAVLAALAETGFDHAAAPPYAARLAALTTPLPDPEQEARVFLVARRAAA